MKKATVSLLFIVLLILPTLSFAQEENTQYKRPELTERVFQITYADLDTVRKTARYMVTRYGKVIGDELGRKIIVRDTADSIEKIAQLIKEMDLPPHRLLLTVFVFEASRTGTGGDLSAVPAKVKKALDEVKSVMAYKNFTLKTSGMINSVARKETRSQLNLSENLSLSCNMNYNPHSKFLMLNGVSLVHRVISQVAKNVQDIKTLFRTDLGIGDGEVVVAGASKLNGGEKALLTIITLTVKETR